MRLFLILIFLVLAACRTLPQQGFEHSSHAAIKRIYLMPLGTPEHAQVRIMNPIGAGFGVVGNLIESRRAAGAGQEMESTLGAAHYDFRTALTNSVAAAVGRAGFTLTRAPNPRPDKDRSRFINKYPIIKRIDAYLDVYASYVGFEALQSSKAYRPRLEISARLVSAKDNQTLFQDRIVYGLVENSDDDIVLVRADDSLSFRNRATLQSDPIRTARALQAAIDAVSWELAKQFM
jgi:hypothetical protein